MAIAAARQARIDAALDMQVRVNGGEFMTRRALVRRCVGQGYRVTTRRNGERVLMSPDGSWFDARNITKTGLDYAETITEQRGPLIGHCACGAVLSAVTGDCVRGAHCRA